jgi:centrin-3
MSVQQEKATRAFQLIDEAQKGVVVLEDLQRIAADLDQELTEEELVEMIQFVDKSSDGLLTPRHFFKIARKVNL